MVKETSRTKNGPRGLRSLQRDRGRPYKCDSPGVVKSDITNIYHDTLPYVYDWS